MCAHSRNETRQESRVSTQTQEPGQVPPGDVDHHVLALLQPNQGQRQTFQANRPGLLFIRAKVYNLHLLPDHRAFKGLYIKHKVTELRRDN